MKGGDHLLVLAADIPQGTGLAELTQDLPSVGVFPSLICMGRSAGSSRPSVMSGPVQGPRPESKDIIIGPGGSFPPE
jgi:hypothetical protein